MSGRDETSYGEALLEGLRQALRSDERVLLLVGDAGGRDGSVVRPDLLEEFGPERVRHTSSEAVLVGVGVGAAIRGMRPVLQISAGPPSLLALARVVEGAASVLHRSGGQCSVPMVIRLTSAAQRGDSLAGWYAHVPGLRIVSPATLQDARSMLPAALADPDPVLVLEHGDLDELRGHLAAGTHAVDLDRAAVRRPGRDVTLVTHGGMLGRTLEAADRLAVEGISAEVVDLRTLRPLDHVTVVASVRRTHRAVVVDEEWRSGSLAAEVVARIQEHAFADLRAGVERVCAMEVPVPWSEPLAAAALPQVESIMAAVRRTGA